jgi:HlyD family secretion protein
MKFDRRWIAAGLVVLAIAAPLALRRVQGAGGLPVEIDPAAEREVRPSILASGVLAHRVEVNLTSEVLARVASISVKEGDTVSAGQLLMRLDPETYNNIIAREEAGQRQNRISIDRQRAIVALREQQYQRSQRLAEAQLIDRNRLDEDRNQYVIAEADLRSAEEALQRASAVLSDAREQRSKTEIRSPIAGRVVSLPIKVGEVAIPSTAALAGAQLMKIADTREIQAEVKVDEADVARIALGQSADVFAAAYPETALKGKVEKIALAPTIDGLGLSADPALLLRSGMSARAVVFLGDGRRQLAVPVEALVTESPDKDQVKRYVWVDANGIARKTVVTTGLSDDRWESIAGGISAGDRVIVGPSRALRQLREGQRVTEQKAKPVSQDEDDDDADPAG